MLLLLLAAVLVPTICVLWFMTQAMHNERLAMQQELTDVYSNQLASVQQRLNTFWDEKKANLALVDPAAAAAEIFADVVERNLADSVVVYDASGRVSYPAKVPFPRINDQTESVAWRRAQVIEFQSADPSTAAEAYATLAGEAIDAETVSRALQAQARCLVKAGQRKAAIDILAILLNDPKYGYSMDTHGNLIVPNAQLHIVELMADSKDAAYQRVLSKLVARLTDYGDVALYSSQRRFLMHELQAVVPDCPVFPTLEAEDLAAKYLESQPLLLEDSHIRPSTVPRLWLLASRGTSISLVALFREECVLSEMQSVLKAEPISSDATVKLIPAGAKSSVPTAFVSTSAGEWLPGWELSLWLDDDNPFAAADRQVAVYLWSGILVVLTIAALAGFVARYVVGQIRLTRLRNDLIATVTHELKTPLSSMRALIDTILEGRCRDQQQHDEYLRLAAIENERLSRLIDNFLAFSRMERNKRTFESSPLEVKPIVTAAVDVVREKFQVDSAQLDVDVADDLPTIDGDVDALTTVLIDLLDNAHKYTRGNKHITVRAYGAIGKVIIEVEDNGVGLSRRAARKVFDRFYQVDQSLSRRVGGCGLGLSIVHFIVKAHGGNISVSSVPGEGSTFTVALPASRSPTAASK